MSTSFAFCMPMFQIRYNSDFICTKTDMGYAAFFSRTAAGTCTDVLIQFQMLLETSTVFAIVPPPCDFVAFILSFFYVCSISLSKRSTYKKRPSLRSGALFFYLFSFLTLLC